MALKGIKIGEEAGNLAPRSRLQATAILIGVQTTNTPHRPLLVTIFRQIATEGVEIPCLASPLSSSPNTPPILTKATASKMHLSQRLPDHPKQRFPRMEMALPIVPVGTRTIPHMGTVLYSTLCKPRWLQL